MIKLSDYSTLPPKDADKKAIKKETAELVERIKDLQELLYAEGKHSLLVIFQGMDASGKDGAVRKVFRDVSPNGINVYSFKKPTEEEFAHDFLWRVHKLVPAKGMIQVFNRSHYEDILIQRVHGWIDEEKAEKRLAAINAFEELLQFDANTVILKFYLHLSYEQQEKELMERVEDPTKHWKHNDGDWEQRVHWDAYRDAYEKAINGSVIPWIITPVDERWYRDYVVAKAIVEALEKLDMQWPTLESERFG